MDDYVLIDEERLRNDLKEMFLGAYFGGGFGAALIDISNVERASLEELINIARCNNFDLSCYIIKSR